MWYSVADVRRRGVRAVFHYKNKRLTAVTVPEMYSKYFLLYFGYETGFGFCNKMCLGKVGVGFC